LPSVTQLACILCFAFIATEFGFRNHPLFRQRRYKFYRLPAVQIALIVITILTVSNGVDDYAVYGQR
jgi:hypothetical protein